MPIKSVTLEKIEKMETDLAAKAKGGSAGGMYN